MVAVEMMGVEVVGVEVTWVILVGGYTDGDNK